MAAWRTKERAARVSACVRRVPRAVGVSGPGRGSVASFNTHLNQKMLSSRMRAWPVTTLDTIPLTMSASLALRTTMKMAVTAKKGMMAYPITPEMSQKIMVMIQNRGVMPTKWARSSSWRTGKRGARAVREGEAGRTSRRTSEFEHAPWRP